MEKEVKYQITLTQSQLRLISEVTEKFARIIIGQISNGIGAEMETAYRKHHDKFIFESKGGDREKLNNLLNEIKKLCFKQEPDVSYGVGYSDKSDTLFDMHEVIRHQLWKDLEDRPDYVNSAYPAHHWNKKVPLIEIEKL